MIPSRNGWRETPYIRVPSGAEELAKNLVGHESSSGIKLWLVTGVTTERDGAPDVMRGEEAQIVGATGAGMGDGIYVMPGTHSKWIRVLGGKIEDYSTYMTGELFGVLKSHTILGTLMAEEPFSDSGFKLGVEASLSGAGDLLHRLFRVRTLPLFGRIGTEMAADYLSGMLIGDEIRAAAGDFGSSMVTIVGGSDLAHRYARALELAGLKSRMAPENIAAFGHFMIAREAGLLP
jgi:2-dehydro-3-deoxygalactonokinase